MDTLRDFRLDIKAAISGKEIDKKQIFTILDNLRDKKLPNLGIKLEDRKEGSIWSYEDRETLLAQIQQEEEQKEEQRKRNLEKKALEERKKATPPEEYFRIFKAEDYSAFDEKGIPTIKVVKTKEGIEEKELSKEQRKELEKEFNKQKKAYEEYLKKQ